MKQNPSRLKYRKYHKPNSSFLFLQEQKNFYPQLGSFALKSIDSGRLTFRQIEAGRRSIRRTVQKQGKLLIRVFTYASLSKRPLGMRMGKGKGSHNSWVSPIRAGQIIYELSGVPHYNAYRALIQAADKLPFKAQVVRLTY